MSRIPKMGEDGEEKSKQPCRFFSEEVSKPMLWSCNNESSCLAPLPHSSSASILSENTAKVSHNSKTKQGNRTRASLLALQPLSLSKRSPQAWPKAASDDTGEWRIPVTPTVQTESGKALRVSDRKKGCEYVQCYSKTTELQTKRNQLAYFDNECSRVADHIYLGSNVVARNREILRKNGITHVLNCVGFVCPDYFKGDLIYKTLWLQDSPCEDITSILYDVFDFFEEVTKQDGRVFVHCCRGISRSTSLVIAYLIWRNGQTFEDAFQYVKAARGITNPNMGFASQLLQCQKRVHAVPMCPDYWLRMYRIAPHSSYAPLHLVPKAVSEPGRGAMDSRGAFIVHIRCGIYLWIGLDCHPVMENAAKSAALQFVRYERAEGLILVIKEGEEMDEFWDAFSKASATTSDMHSLNQKNSPTTEFQKEHVNGTSSLGLCHKRVEAYDNDYELFSKALAGGVVPPFSVSACGTETRLPAREHCWGLGQDKYINCSMKHFVATSKVNNGVTVEEMAEEKEVGMPSTSREHPVEDGIRSSPSMTPSLLPPPVSARACSVISSIPS